MKKPKNKENGAAAIFQELKIKLKNTENISRSNYRNKNFHV